MMKLIAITLALAMTVPYMWAIETVASSATQRELQQIQGEIRELEGQIDEESALLQNLRQELRDLRDEMYRLDMEMARITGNIHDTEAAIAALSESIDVMGIRIKQEEAALMEARRNLGEAQEVLAARVRAMHENGQINILDVLFNAESVTDFLVRLEDLRTLIRFNRDLLARLTDYETEYRDSVDALYLSEGIILSLRIDYERQKDDLEWHLDQLFIQLDEKHAFLDELEENEERFELLLELLEKEHYELIQRGVAVQARFDREVAAAAFAHARRATAPRVTQPVLPGAGTHTQGVTAPPLHVGTAEAGHIRRGISQETHEMVLERMRGFSVPVARFDGVFLWPVPGIRYISAGFNQISGPWGLFESRHDGIDIMANSGHMIVAADDGVVVHNGWSAALGLTVIIDHENGYRTVYGHNLRNHVVEGQRVTRGQHIADVGQSGSTLFDHLHFEVHLHGSRVDPMRYFR